MCVVVVAAACASSPARPAVDARRRPTPTTALTVVPSVCHYSPTGGPDPACTPGATDPAVTQADIATTICVPGYTATVRPPVSYTAPLKRQLMRAYGDGGPPSAYELDHEVPLELGGAPRDPHNLWPEMYPGAAAKDHQENLLHRQVCAGTISLAAAQATIRTVAR